MKNTAAAAKLVMEGARAVAVRVDVTCEDDCRRLMDEARRLPGRFDILVNNAGTNIRKQPEDYGLDEWQLLIEVNLGSVYKASLAAFPTLRDGGGKIINIGSMTSIFGASFAAPYGAAKGGVVQLTKSLASAWARYGIQVNAILPGWIETDLTVRGRAATPKLQEQVTDRTPAGRWGKPEDLGGAAVFLASQASDFITGVALPVDGGYSVQA